MNKVTKATKILKGMSDEEIKEVLEFLTPEEVKEEEPKEEVVVEEEVKEEPKEEKKEEQPNYVTEEGLKTILEEILGKVATKEEVKEVSKKAQPFGKDPKVVTKEGKPELDLGALLAKVNSQF